MTKFSGAAPEARSTAAATAAGNARDSQRSKIYDVQHLVMRVFDRAADFPTMEVAGSHMTVPVERKFASIENVQSYVDAFLALSWVRETWPRAVIPVKVRIRAGDQAAHYERQSATMAVPGHVGGTAWAMRELVILHELAHHLDPTGEPAHSAEFAGILLDVIGEIIGPEAALLMRVTMGDVGVKVR